MPGNLPRLHFNGDGTSDLLWQAKDGLIHAWHFSANRIVDPPLVIFGKGAPIVGTGDFNGDGRDDMLQFSPPFPEAGRPDGLYTVSAVQGLVPSPPGLGVLPPIDFDWKLVGVGDFNGDRRDDLLFRGTGDIAGRFLINELNSTPGGDSLTTRAATFADPGAAWAVLDLADFNGDGRTDILWQHSNTEGQTDARSIWLMDETTIIGGGMVADPGSDWSVIGTGDFNNDGKADLLWHHEPTGWNTQWLMDGARLDRFGASIPSPGDFWTLGGV